MNPTTRKLMVWACVAAQVSFLFCSFNAIRLFTPALEAFLQRAQLTMLPHPTRLLLAHPNMAAAIPILMIGVLCASVGLVYRRLREEADQLVCALVVQVLFWVMSLTYAGSVGMAAVLPFIHIANR